MSEQDFREIARNGLWRNNPGLVQLLGLCPLLGTRPTPTRAKSPSRRALRSIERRVAASISRLP